MHEGPRTRQPGVRHVVVAPPGRVESRCVAEVLRATGITAETDVVGGSPDALVLLAVAETSTAGVAHWLHHTHPGVPLLLVVQDVSPRSLALARAIRAQAVLAETASGAQLRQSLDAMVRGETCVPSPVPASRTDDPLDQLTDRERQVFAMLADGRPDSEIAGVLGISVNTVRTHVQHVRTKLEAPHRQAVAVMAQRRARKAERFGQVRS